MLGVYQPTRIISPTWPVNPPTKVSDHLRLDSKDKHTVELKETPIVDTIIANVPSTMTNAKQHNAVESVTRARVSALLNGTRCDLVSIKYAPSFRTEFVSAGARLQAEDTPGHQGTHPERRERSPTVHRRNSLPLPALHPHLPRCPPFWNAPLTKSEGRH